MKVDETIKVDESCISIFVLLKNSSYPPNISRLLNCLSGSQAKDPLKTAENSQTPLSFRGFLVAKWYFYAFFTTQKERIFRLDRNSFQKKTSPQLQRHELISSPKVGGLAWE